MKRKVLFCIDKFNHRGGATKSLIDLINYNDQLDHPIVVCSFHVTKEVKERFNVIEGSAKDVIDIYLNKEYEIIHYFKADGNTLLRDMNAYMRKFCINAKVVMTVCQKPSYKRFLLSHKEIAPSNKIVFIDKAAYNDKLYTFIPEIRKTVIYCGCTDKTIKYTAELLSSFNSDNDCPVIGRASRLVKCPPDTFEIFDKIDNPKKIVIIGDGPEFDFFKRESTKHESYETVMVGDLPYNDYLKEISKFDIFLYYLPPSAHSSIDYTLGDAMLLKKPCVYYGPPAPSERIVNGVNGFIAKSKDELSYLCNHLLRDKSLQFSIGENARESTIKNFSIWTTVEKYNKLYDKLPKSDQLIPIKVPLSFKLYYYQNEAIIMIKRIVNKILRLSKIQFQIGLE